MSRNKEKLMLVVFLLIWEEFQVHIGKDKGKYFGEVSFFQKCRLFA